MSQKQEARVYTDKFGNIIIEDMDGQPQFALDQQAKIITEQAEIIASQEEIIENQQRQIERQKQPPKIESEGWFRALSGKRQK